MEQNSERPQSIPELFKGKSVLVTGATGFLGKVLVEKLLRSCPDVRELFILLRPSKSGDVDNRLRLFLDHRVFDKLRKDRSEALRQVRAITGDITLDNMGLSEWQLKKVTSDVSFVFHCAANVRFDEEARITLTANLLGAKNVLDVCKKCEKLEAFVHVSTAFSFCNYTEISEKLYPVLVRPEHILECLSWMTEDQFKTLCMHYIQERPSLYHFSKALAEVLIAKTAGSLPVIIVRPSIVTASVKEPYPGWIDNYNGPSGFIAVCGKGIVKTLLVEPDVNADWVPVDIVANTLIVAAHYIAVNSKLDRPTLKLICPSEVPIINCTCPSDNLITWVNMVEICLPFLIDYPSQDVYGKPGGTVTSSHFRYAVCRIMNHYIPAVLIDCALVLIWRKPKLITLYKSIHKVMGHLEHYTTHPFIFHSPNMSLLLEQLDPSDRKIFNTDQSGMNWTLYMKTYVLGVRRHFLREDDKTLPEARVKMMRIHYIWMALKISSILGIFMALRLFMGYNQKYPKRSLLPSFPIFSAIHFIQRKFKQNSVP